jgi:hypothetical protein
MTPLDNQAVRGGVLLKFFKGGCERSELRFLLPTIGGRSRLSPKKLRYASFS